ncbi:hypothetical protein CVV72_11380 [Amycolatopsis sp. TNS106]|nr:hypothetical protein CVV72_11380 [Amycolatopsis sp. TNS106]
MAVGSAEMPDERSAVALARAAGHRVEAVNLRTETARTFAAPDGTLTYEQHLQPVRVKHGAVWRSVDTTLRVRPDGAIEPVASAVPIRFSRGGGEPLVRFGSQQATVTFPGVLPKPVIDGNIATYPQVSPGVDLRVRADPGGFSSGFTIRDAQALKNLPTLRSSEVSTPAVARPDSFPADVGGPTWHFGRSDWTSVFAEHRDVSYWNGAGLGNDGRARVGFSGDWEPKAVTVRSYFQFDVSPMFGKHILGAEVNFQGSWGASCQKHWIELHQTHPISPQTTWNNQPVWPRHLGSDDRPVGRSGCENRIGFDMAPSVRDAVVARGPATVVLKDRYENNQYAWKKFDNNPQLVVEYNTPPEAPGALGVGPDLACGVEPNEPHVATSTPTLYATANDKEGRELRVQFEWRERFNHQPLGSQETVDQLAGNRFSVTIPPGQFGDGGKIGWRARGFDGIDWGPWSEFCDITIDQTPPDREPVVKSTVYPENDLGGGAGKTGLFSFDANGVSDVVGFAYGLSGEAEHYVQAVDGKATAPVTPPRVGPMDLTVWSKDKAGNRALVFKRYHFLVGEGAPAIRHWRMDGYPPGTKVLDSTGRGHEGEFVPGQAAWTAGRVDDALRFNGVNGHVSMGPKSGVDTQGTFSVSAWARLDELTDTSKTVVSQDGNHASAFYLQYRGRTRQWAFIATQQDTVDPATDMVVSAAEPVIGAWTHLIGVFDGAQREIRLYVNGRFVGSAPHLASAPFPGPVQIGRAKWNDGYTDHWPGAIDDVRLHDRMVIDGRNNAADQVKVGSEVHQLANLPAPAEADWAMDDLGVDLSGNYREATFSGGYSTAPGKVGSGALQLNGVDGQMSTTGPLVRTDNSFTVSAWVRPGSFDGKSRTVVSQDGIRASGFYLQYHAGSNKWMFMMSPRDEDNFKAFYAFSARTVQVDRWTHLAGVYDATSRELRLYVNGVLEASTPGDVGWNSTGPFRVGRAMWNGDPVDYWNGAIDEVRAYSGARTDDQISQEFLSAEAERPFIRNGLSRYFGHNGDHISSSTLRPTGHFLEATLGTFAPAGAPDTVMLYSCMNGADAFTSPDPACEGKRRLGVLGPIYTTAPAGEPVTALYRCLDRGGEHFDSVLEDCEGETREARLGYVRAFAPLVRYVQPDHPGDHWATTALVPATYRPEATLGWLSLADRPGTTDVFSCLAGTDEFTSTDSACEGKTKVQHIGRVWTTAVPGSIALLRCATTDSGERFVSTHPRCEGQRIDRTLGYLLRNP